MKTVLVIRSNKLRIFLKIIIIPVIVLITFLSGRSVSGYLTASFIIAVFSLLLFICGFEKKKIGTRRMVIISVMISLCIVGRFIPFFKPVTAITVITAVYIGAESGFLVGSLSALLSNFYFGQGPWTPFQMLSLGLIGFIAGVLSKYLKKKPLLLTYGVCAGATYSLIMDVWTVLWYNHGFDPSLYTTAIYTAVPHMTMYCISNFLFLWFIAKPFGEKLERVRLKYGI